MTNAKNPYSTPSHTAQKPAQGVRMDPKDKAKLDAVVKDAGQFWLACILCILCSVIGAILIPIWYTIRLLQWNKLAKKYPKLMTGNPRKGSLQAKFQSSQWKLIVGLVLGCVIFCLVVGLFVLNFIVLAGQR